MDSRGGELHIQSYISLMLLLWYRYRLEYLNYHTIDRTTFTILCTYSVIDAHIHITSTTIIASERSERADLVVSRARFLYLDLYGRCIPS